VRALLTTAIGPPFSASPPVSAESSDYMKDVFERRLKFTFSEEKIRKYEQVRAHIGSLHRQERIRFFKNHSDLSKELNDRAAFEIVYLGINCEVDFQLDWETVAFLNSIYPGSLHRLERFKYLGNVNSGMKSVISGGKPLLERLMRVESMHLAQHFLRDISDLDNDNNTLLFTDNQRMFLETAEFLNTRLFDWVEDHSIDLFSPIEIPSTNDPGYVAGAKFANILLDKLGGFGSAVRENPLPYFQAYSQILALVDFSHVGSQAHKFGLYLDGLRLGDFKKNLQNLETLTTKKREELLRLGYKVEIIEKMIQLAKEDMAKHRDEIGLLSVCASPDRQALDAIANAESQFALGLMQLMILITTPEQLLIIADESMKRGSFNGATRN